MQLLLSQNRQRVLNSLYVPCSYSQMFPQVGRHFSVQKCICCVSCFSCCIHKEKWNDKFDINYFAEFTLRGMQIYLHDEYFIYLRDIDQIRARITVNSTNLLLLMSNLRFILSCVQPETYFTCFFIIMIYLVLGNELR